MTSPGLPHQFEGPEDNRNLDDPGTMANIYEHYTMPPIFGSGFEYF